MKESLINRIKKYLKSQGKEVNITDIYGAFPEQKRTTIRGRINENVDRGIKRVDKGLYISADVIVEHADIMKRISAMKDAGMKYEFIFLDIPYHSAGQNGGNRKIAKFETITPQQFKDMLDGMRDILTDNGTLQFMITSGKSSKSAVDKYRKCFDDLGYVKIKSGQYTKMNGNGTRCNIGKYLLPEEDIVVYAKHANVDASAWMLDIAEVRTLGYPTEKPVSLMKILIEQATKIGDWILDPFGGSGATLKACLMLDRKCHIMDISAESIYKHILPILGINENKMSWNSN